MEIIISVRNLESCTIPGIIRKIPDVEMLVHSLSVGFMPVILSLMSLSQEVCTAEASLFDTVNSRLS